MPDTTMIFTNVSDGDTIFSPFQLIIEYNLLTEQAATLTVTDADGASITTSPLILQPTGGTPTSVSVTLTFTSPPAPITDASESIQAILTDSSLNVLSSDTVGNLNVNLASNTSVAPVSISGQVNFIVTDHASRHDQAGRGKLATHAIKKNAQASGTCQQPATKDNTVFLIVQKRKPKGKHHQATSFQKATFTDATKTVWTQPALANGTFPGDKGDCLVAMIVDVNLNILGVTRAQYK
jgi:hypothetical protein